MRRRRYCKLPGKAVRNCPGAVLHHPHFSVVRFPGNRILISYLGNGNSVNHFAEHLFAFCLLLLELFNYAALIGSWFRGNASDSGETLLKLHHVGVFLRRKVVEDLLLCVNYGIKMIVNCHHHIRCNIFADLNRRLILRYAQFKVFNKACCVFSGVELDNKLSRRKHLS